LALLIGRVRDIAPAAVQKCSGLSGIAATAALGWPVGEAGVMADSLSVDNRRDAASGAVNRHAGG